MLKSLFDQAKSKLLDLKNEAIKYKSKEFLHAALGGSALVIMADGNIDANEKSKMMRFIQSNDALSIYETSEVVKIWKDYIETIELDADIGEAKAFDALGKIKGKDDQAKLVMRMVIAIGAADGNFDPDEKRIASRVARELDLEPSEFGLA
ncbi:tellurite resistance TerB family protein [Endozoicomonas euniceicola]|uniref:TerB family tellurite resistance protein n=1 Tax=Endozoicomonas euniceicola TaxID=1234143 RepID=A0ABY6GQS2_9GAMM|nr:TerB family tellurite resistance protein [Endozoicomonas euniceicola]UYM14912.1 TerB family tellurite resistance protein [Endozoicomonas euniceicola]